jgi:hypothetical protein
MGPGNETHSHVGYPSKQIFPKNSFVAMSLPHPNKFSPKTRFKTQVPDPGRFFPKKHVSVLPVTFFSQKGLLYQCPVHIRLQPCINATGSSSVVGVTESWRSACTEHEYASVRMVEHSHFVQ